ncbi:DNA polymerase III subunit epsilon [Pararobbsia alpina]
MVRGPGDVPIIELPTLSLPPRLRLRVAKRFAKFSSRDRNDFDRYVVPSPVGAYLMALELEREAFLYAEYNSGQTSSDTIMRQLILDTETTGLNARSGDRIIEFGAVELVNRRLTGRNLHFYINPERDSDPGALAVHGLTTEFLSDKPKFAEIANQILDFVAGADLIIHNAPFDLGFLDAEFSLLGQPTFSSQCGEVIDTLVLAKSMYPGKRNSLDALCDRLGVSNAHRTLHGALLDSELLAEVYLALTRGQESLVIDMLGETAEAEATGTQSVAAGFAALDLPVVLASEDEQAAHDALLDGLDKAVKGACVWRAEPKTEEPGTQAA